MEHAKVIEVRARLHERKGHWVQIGKASGVSYSWLSQFARGKITNPTINTLQAVADACEAINPEARTLRAEEVAVNHAN